MNTNQNKKKDHIYFMTLALQQAKRVLGNTKANPSVGCVVIKNGHLIGAGRTSVDGRPHAEQNAFHSSKINNKNSLLYSTLEPCSHYGKTPPCVNRIIKEKVKKVYFSIKDPDIRSFNKCSKKLRNVGIYVNEGIYKNKIISFYKDYLNIKTNKLPYVTCKIAISKDFYTINKKNRWITNEFSRGRVHLMRSNHDCIISSSQTILNDNPKLTCRINGLKSFSPARVILDNKLKIKVYSNVIKEADRYSTIIFYNKMNKRKIQLLNKLKVKTFKIPLDNKGNLDILRSLYKVKELGFSRVFLESGIKLTSNFLSNNLVNNFVVFTSNNNLKKNGRYSFKSYLKNFLRDKKSKIEKVNLLGDHLTSYELK